MKKIVIDGVIYSIKNTDFKKYCEDVKSKYGDGIPVDGVYFTNG